MSEVNLEVSYYDDVKMWWLARESVERRVADHTYLVRHVPSQDPAIALCARRRTVVQAGAHVGVWPLALARKFARVVTFEPSPSTFEALRRNIRDSGLTNITAYDHGLSDADRWLPFDLTYSAARSRITGKGATFDCKIRVRPLDELLLNEVDMMFLDLEGHECEALDGAKETIARCRPIIQVELWPKRAMILRTKLTDLGYKPMGRISKDEYYAPVQ
jgi:FkbM family methyltransferase